VFGGFEKLIGDRMVGFEREDLEELQIGKCWWLCRNGSLNGGLDGKFGVCGGRFGDEGFVEV
jgi:hypothetical protein